MASTPPRPPSCPPDGRWSCEGYLDVIAAHAAGITNAVASCGTALGPDHFRLLGRFCATIVLAFDADTAGGDAAARLHDMEARFRMELAVAELPAGTDPGDLGSTAPDQLRSAVDNAAPLLGYTVNRVLRRGATDSIGARVRTANAALDVVAQHPDRLKQRVVTSRSNSPSQTPWKEASMSSTPGV